MTRRPRLGFSLPELMVVMAVIAVLLALTTIGIQAARESSRRAQCTNNLKQIGIALTNYAGIHRAVLPAGCAGCDGGSNGRGTAAPPDVPGTSAFVQLLPFLEQQALYAQIEPKSVSATVDFNAWLSRNAEAVATRIEVFRCPSDNSPDHVSDANPFGTPIPPGVKLATSNYAFVHGTMGPSHGTDPTMKYHNNGTFVYYHTFDLAAATGMSETIIVGEVIEADRARSLNCWAVANRHQSSLRSTENPLNTPPGTGDQLYQIASTGAQLNGAFASRHPGGVYFLYGDGHVDFLSETIGLSELRDIATPGGNPFSAPLLPPQN